MKIINALFLVFVAMVLLYGCASSVKNDTADERANLEAELQQEIAQNENLDQELNLEELDQLDQELSELDMDLDNL